LNRKKYFNYKYSTADNQDSIIDSHYGLLSHELLLNNQQSFDDIATGKRVRVCGTQAHARDSEASATRWGIVLAGGDGTRLRSLSKLISGDERPKQFCRVLGENTLLENTIERIEIGIPHDNILISLTHPHEKFYTYLYSRFNKEQLIVQPANLGTAPAILYSLLRVAKESPEASVAFFPSDHYLSDNARFMDQINLAFDTVHAEPKKLVLLGITPKHPETAYGWIEPVYKNRSDDSESVRQVKRFWEKPSKNMAVELMKEDCLWNSFVMVGSVLTFLKIIRRSLPGIYHEFQSLSDRIGTKYEEHAVDAVYRNIDATNFSHQVLEVCTEDLMVLKVRNVDWSDLGEPQRVLSTLESTGRKLEWTNNAYKLVSNAV
jgi:mannose-1-phosphate guanylyltransferase